MKLEAVEQASARLRKAERALASLKSSSNFEDAEEAWSDFLLAVSGIYSKLEQGAKGNGKSTGWFGRFKKARKDDPLLRYLHFARNSDEHGIERITSRSGCSTLLGTVPPFGHRIPAQFRRIDGVTKEPTGDWIDGFVPGPHLTLTRATNTRFGDFADPPKLHLGEAVDHRYPADVGSAVMPYLREILETAANIAA